MKRKSSFKKPEINTIEQLSAQLIVANKQLADLNDKLTESEKARSEMLANISHDLRAPATALRSAIDCLLAVRETPDEEKIPLLEIMDRRMSALEHLISDLHFLVSLDLPEFRMDLQHLSVAPFLEEYFVTQQMDKKYEKRLLHCDIPDGFDASIEGDPDYLIRVLDNLFSNALRYSRDGDSISLSCRPAKTAPNFVEIMVSDTGIGIAPQYLEAIFERTRTLSASRTPDGTSGSGLGLSIVRNIMDKHNGVVYCESAPGMGSTFILRLPVTEAGNET